MENLWNQNLLTLFGNLVKKYREQQNMSEYQLAKKTGKAEKRIKSIEAGRINIGMYEANVIANALNLPMSHLFVKSTQSE